MACKPFWENSREYSVNKRLQVFVSSTYTDLIEERQAAVSAILKSGHIPAGMELFTSGDKSQWETIKRWIDESDVYMLILGGRYGSIEPDSGLSYTELEYNYALEIGKPLFACVIQPDALDIKVREKGREVFENKNPQLLQDFQKKVLSNMSAFFDDCKDIRLCVLESLPEISATRELSGWISGKEVPDTKGLIDEVTKLNQENSDLKSKNALLQKKLDVLKKSDQSYDFDDIFMILDGIKVKVKKELVDTKEDMETTLLTFFYANKDRLVLGVTSRSNQDNYTYFIYQEICPKLAIHGLVESQDVKGGYTYRRFLLTKKGMDFLAHLERTHLNK